MIPRRRETTTEGTVPGTASSASASASAKSNSSSKIGLKSIGMMFVLVAMGLNSNRDLLWNDNDEPQDYGKAREKYQQQQTEKYSTLDNYNRSDTQPSGKFVLKAENEFKPGIAWLMTFPNSGTSYTMSMVSRSTNRSFATNYGKEVISEHDKHSISIYPRRPEGPYWTSPEGTKVSWRPLPGPDQFVITKTHCSSRCAHCGPREYVETADYFLEQCASGSAFFTPGGERRQYQVAYPPSRVQRAIHLYRNPIHNIIARYNLWQRNVKHLENRDESPVPLDIFTKDAQGFHNYCEYFGRYYQDGEKQHYGGKEKIPKAPCHAEFFKYTQWHNHAHEAFRTLREGGGPRKELPVLTMYYEDYSTDLNQTCTKVLDFLKLEQVHPFREFSSRSDYGSYFTLEQQVEIKKLIRSVASNETWADIRHYLEDIPDECTGESEAAAATWSNSSEAAEIEAETETSPTANGTTTTTNGNPGR